MPLFIRILFIIFWTYCLIVVLKIICFENFWYQKILKMIVVCQIGLCNDYEREYITDLEFDNLIEQFYPQNIFRNLFYIVLVPWVWGARMCCRPQGYNKLVTMYNRYKDVEIY